MSTSTSHFFKKLSYSLFSQHWAKALLIFTHKNRLVSVRAPFLFTTNRAKISKILLKNTQFCLHKHGLELSRGLIKIIQWCHAYKC